MMIGVAGMFVFVNSRTFWIFNGVHCPLFTCTVILEIDIEFNCIDWNGSN